MTHGANRKTVVAAAAVVHAPVIRIEVEVPRVVRKARIERRGPIVAVAAGIKDLTTPTVAGSREEDAISIRSGELASIDAVQGRPLDGGFVEKFLPRCL